MSQADEPRTAERSATASQSAERLLFVTGRLAEPSLRAVLAELAAKVGITCEVAVLPITVAALMHPGWVLRKLTVPAGITRVILPGWCQGDLGPLVERWGVPFECGPKDLFDLPEFFGRGRRAAIALEEYSIEILAEINHAPRLELSELLRQADQFRTEGADLIDLGCIPGESWTGIGTATRALIAAGHRVSVDSFDRLEVESAVVAGAELVLSVNGSNRDWATTIPVEFVAIPETPPQTETLAETAAIMSAAGRTVRWDPILEPIGFGFAASLQRYQRVRAEHPDVPMMMGVGNVTELTEVDSAGVNFLLAAICEELRITSILTTSVINWARGAVREFDLARRIVRQAIARQVIPKHLDSRLVMLRDPRLSALGSARLAQLAGQLTDPNFRIFAERGEVHLMNRDGYWHGDDPYEVFDRMLAAVGSLTPEHAFYLGAELMKARTALTLGKNYRQDEALRWGWLTVEEESALARRHDQRRREPSLSPEAQGASSEESIGDADRGDSTAPAGNR